MEKLDLLVHNAYKGIEHLSDILYEKSEHGIDVEDKESNPAADNLLTEINELKYAIEWFAQEYGLWGDWRG